MIIVDTMIAENRRRTAVREAAAAVIDGETVEVVEEHITIGKTEI